MSDRPDRDAGERDPGGRRADEPRPDGGERSDDGREDGQRGRAGVRSGATDGEPAPTGLGDRLGTLPLAEQFAGGGLAASALVLLALVVLGVLDVRYLLFLLSLAGVYVLLTMGLNVHWGYTGMINFSVAAFFGIGAYGVALATSSASPIAGGLPPTVGLLTGLVGAGVLALLIGLPTLSLEEDYLAIATLGLAEVVRLVLRSETQWTNGTAGLYGIPRLYANWPLVGAVTGRTAEATVNFLVVLVAVVGVWVGLRRIHRSPWGRVQRLIRTDPDLAEALGKDTYRRRLQSFVIGSLVMALAGGLYASAIVFVDPGLLDPIQTFYVWIAVIMGGTGSDRGAILGGILVVGIIEGTRTVGSLAPVGEGSLRLLAIGVLIILVIYLRPQGVLPPRGELIWPGTEGKR